MAGGEDVALYFPPPTEAGDGFLAASWLNFIFPQRGVEEDEEWPFFFSPLRPPLASFFLPSKATKWKKNQSQKSGHHHLTLL